VRKVQKTTTYFLPIYLVIIGSFLCISLNAQEQQGDTLKPISNFKRWYQNLLPTPYDGPKNKLRIPMAVGYYDFDDNIRDLQLLGKLQPEQSLTIRPYILTPKLGYDSLLAMIDPEFENRGHIVERKHSDIQLLPINFLQKYNSHHPYGWNDGPLSFSKGYQFVGSGGVYMRWRNIHLTLRPEFFKTASDPYETSADWGQRTSALSKLTLGQSSLRIDFGPLSVGASTQNLWLGPGRYSSLLMSNNAPGFNHFSVGTNRPIKTPLGSFELNIIGGTLTANDKQSFESKGLKIILPTDDKRYIPFLTSTRYLNLLSITYSPIFFKNFYIGANRAFQQFTQPNPSNKLTDYYLIALKPLFRNKYQDNILAIDQYIAGFAKYLFPQTNAEVYFEYGWNDGSSNSRDLILDMSHSAASIFGIKKIQYLNQNSYLSIEAEATQMAQRPSYLQRNADNWYEHGFMQAGYSNENQIFGSGSGLGNNVQTFAISFNNGWNKYGIKFQHIEQDPMQWMGRYPKEQYLRDTKWDDFTYGLNIKQKYKSILFNLNMEWVNSKNYLWQNNNKVSNVYVFLNTIYLW
jgi:hypothetical protein